MLDRAVATPIIEERWGHFVELLEGLDPGGFSAPTLLPGWTIADLASHVSWGIAMEQDAVSKMLAGTESPAVAEPIPVSEEPARLTGGIAERTASLVSTLQAVGDGEAAGLVPMPYGPTPFPFVVQIFVMEAAAHTDDLAMALGLDESISAEAATATYVVMGGSLPVLAMGSSDEPEEGVGFQLAGPDIGLAVARRNGEWVLGDPGDRTTTVEGDATALTRFVLGRIPATDEGLRIDGDHAPMFKRYFPGP